MFANATFIIFLQSKGKNQEGERAEIEWYNTSQQLLSCAGGPGVNISFGTKLNFLESSIISAMIMM